MNRSPRPSSESTAEALGGRHPHLARLDALAAHLARCPDVLAVLGLGSSGREVDRFDDHSDLDFFVVVEDDQAKARYAADLSWLEAAGLVTYQFANEPHGRKVLFDDGLFAEYAVFTITDLYDVPYAGARVVWQHHDAPADLAERGRPPLRPALDTVEFHLGEAVTNLLVGMHREIRGERLTATRFVQGFAVDRMLDLLRLQTQRRQHSGDPFDPSRRVEQMYPPDDLPLARLLPGYGANPQAAAAALDWLRDRFDVDPAIAGAVEQLISQARSITEPARRSDGAPSGRTVLIEVGGSRVRTAWAGLDGPDRKTQRALTGPLGSRDMSAVLDDIAASAADGSGLPERTVVAWPGPLSPDGRAMASPTVAAGVTRLDVAAELSRRWHGATVHVVNDLTAAGARLAAGGARDFTVVNVGSGVGHKVFHDGEPLVGPTGRGGELGHLLVDRSTDAPVCSCGRRGHLGGLASGRGVVAAVVETWRRDGRPIPLDGHDAGPQVLAAFAGGDAITIDVVHDRARLLGWGLAALHAAVGTETFVLVGGFALAAGEDYRRAVVEGAADSTWDLGLSWDAAIRVGDRDDDHGVMGAWHVARGLGWLG